MNLLTISGSPHVHGGQSVKKIMYGVVLAMLPIFLSSVYFFGLDALRVVLISVAACIFVEWLIDRYLLSVPSTVGDGSAIVTGMLLAFNVPSNLPWWIIVIGAIVSIGIGKMAFGGLGKNPFNPALVGRVFLLVSFPVQMTSWPKPSVLSTALTDVITGPTPLGVVKEGLKNGEKMQDVMSQVPSFMEQLMGDMGGSLGEVSAIAILIGGAYMLIRKIITWEIPVSFIGAVLVMATVLWLVDPNAFVNPLFHLVTGGLMLGAVFMATDMVTSPMSRWGMIIFGVGCGLLTVIIRNWGAYPEGVSFAILLMNAVVPLINRGLKPRLFGNKAVVNK